MSKDQWTDDRIVKAINGTAAERDRALQYIFQESGWERRVIDFVSQNGGNAQDGEDIFQETLVLFDRNIRLGYFEGKSALGTYFIGIAKRRWWKTLERRRPSEELKPQHYEAETESADAFVLNAEKKQYIQTALAQTGARCQQLFQLYQLEYTMEELARELQLSSAAMAKKEAYRCRQRLRQFFDDNPGWKQLFT